MLTQVWGKRCNPPLEVLSAQVIWNTFHVEAIKTTEDVCTISSYQLFVESDWQNVVTWEAMFGLVNHLCQLQLFGSRETHFRTSKLTFLQIGNLSTNVVFPFCCLVWQESATIFHWSRAKIKHFQGGRGLQKSWYAYSCAHLKVESLKIYMAFMCNVNLTCYYMKWC